MFAALCGALARAGSAAAAGWDQRDPARPSPARQPPASPFSGQSRGGCNPKTWLDFCCCWEKNTFVSEKKSGCCIIFVVYKNPLAPGASPEIGDSQNTVLQLIADMGSAGQAAMSSAKVRICMCVCVGTDGGGLSTARED